MTSGLDAILVAFTESTYGRQDSGKTPKPSLNLYGNGQVTIKRIKSFPWVTQTGAKVNRPIMVDMSHASVCSNNMITRGTTSHATASTASYARIADFQTYNSNETMT